MSIVVGSSTTNLTSGASSDSFSHTVASGSNRLLLVAVCGMRSATGSQTWQPTAVTFGGVSLTEVITEQHYTTNRDYTVSFWGLAAPSISTGTVAVTFDRVVADAYTTALNLTGATQSAAYVSEASDPAGGIYASDAAFEADLTPSAIGNLLIAGGSVRGDNGSGWTPEAGITEIVDAASGTANTEVTASLWYFVATTIASTSVDSTAPFILGTAQWIELAAAEVLVTGLSANSQSSASMGTVSVSSNYIDIEIGPAAGTTSCGMSVVMFTDNLQAVSQSSASADVELVSSAPKLYDRSF